MRLFAALPLPTAIVPSLMQSLEPARERCTQARWVAVTGMHVTLHFFGDCTDEQLNALKRVFEDPALRAPAIAVRLGPVGQFPERGAPRVLWVGFARGEEAMRAYWELFESRIAPLGWQRDARGFTPHVTIARAGAAPVPRGWAEGISAPSTDFYIEECVLFQSVLDRAGATYYAQSRMGFGRGSP
jgi:RNA 2',3'-cyclic 3'-phosphodiesterase